MERNHERWRFLPKSQTPNLSLPRASSTTFQMAFYLRSPHVESQKKWYSNSSLNYQNCTVIFHKWKIIVHSVSNKKLFKSTLFKVFIYYYYFFLALPFFFLFSVFPFSLFSIFSNRYRSRLVCRASEASRSEPPEEEGANA